MSINTTTAKFVKKLFIKIMPPWCTCLFCIRASLDRVIPPFRNRPHDSKDLAQTTTAAKTSQKKGFKNESCKVLFCTRYKSLYISQPTYAKQTSTPRGRYFYKTLHEFSFSQYLSTYKQKGSKVFLLSNARHPCMRCPTRCDRGQKNQLALSRKFGICINSEKEDNLVRYSQIFEKFFLEISFHLTFIREFPEFSFEWFAFRK